MSESKIKAAIAVVDEFAGYWSKSRLEAMWRELDAQDKAGRGFRGKVNIYVCQECGGHTVYRDLAAGVTPFMTQCSATEGCKGHMYSSMYRVMEDGKARFREERQWYRPSYTEYTTLEPFARDHVERGGLLPRKAIFDA